MIEFPSGAYSFRSEEDDLVWTLFVENPLLVRKDGDEAVVGEYEEFSNLTEVGNQLDPAAYLLLQRVHIDLVSRVAA